MKSCGWIRLGHMGVRHGLALPVKGMWWEVYVPRDIGEGVCICRFLRPVQPYKLAYGPREPSCGF